MGPKLPSVLENLDVPDTKNIERFCENSTFEIEFVAQGNQLWLKSDNPIERPIGISIDETLERHLSYFKKSSLYKENLAKSLGIRPGIRPRVLDLTGGMLGDTLMMLAMGCEVTTIERHPVVAFLIMSAIKNAHHPLMSNHHFLETSAIEYLNSIDQFDVIYFDPMFEDANHKAGPKKEMRIFREMVGNDADAREVLQLARTKATKRVVVKRPRHSETLVGGECLQYLGKSTRYDTYLNVK